MENNYKEWEERSNEEKMASIREYSKSIILKSISEKKAFWMENMSAKQIDETLPFNASTGKPYSGITSLLLRATANLNGYEKPEFLTMKQANLMGGKLKKELDSDGNEIKTAKGATKYVRGVKIALFTNTEYREKRDDNGEIIMMNVKDKEGKQVLNEEGQPLTRPVMEKVFLKTPKLETVTLYHTSCFDDLKKEKLQERNLDDLNNFREKMRNTPYEMKIKVDSLGLGKIVSLDLENFLNSQNKGIDYEKIQFRQQEKTQDKTQNQNKGREI